MHERCHVSLLLYMMFAALGASFNIDVMNPDVYNGEQKDYFGYKVLQFASRTKKGILVTAPLQRNGTGGVCKPDVNQTTMCFNPAELYVEDKRIPVKHFGLSMATDSTRSLFTVCSPSVTHECNKNSYVNGVCYQLTDELRHGAVFTPAFQECTKRTVDLGFLFDGSQSMTDDEFEKNKDFIKDVMSSLKNTSINFAAVQFGTDYRTVFDFEDYKNGRALEKLRTEPHMATLTNTHGALEFMLKEIFENRDAGASRDAVKVLVVITDGDPSDTDSKNIIRTYDEKHIFRLVIGVKILNLDKVKTIASDPKDTNAFRIENYGGLTGILENFQEKIFKMEGYSLALAGDLNYEMSQSGFSAVFYRETLVLGSVGSRSWRGSLYERNDGAENHIEDPHMQTESYLGYSVSVGEMNGARLYFAGAPRFEHVGQVVVFSHSGNTWNTVQRINGDQIGSYFGAELCSVDIDTDGDIDFLLVGAPLFYHSHEKTEGQIYVYTLTEETQLRSELQVAAPSTGRFGSTVASLADLNGDGLRDVAVGAPLEDGNSGAVYIYLGDRHRGIRSTFSQRITGQKIKPELRFFGQAIDGRLDLGDDGLSDVVVGSYGTAVVLKSRPVFNVTAQLSFQPEEISTDRFDCSGGTDVLLPMVNLSACFQMLETTRSSAGAKLSGLNMSVMLDVDPMRQTYRGLFSGTDRKARNLSSVYELQEERTCFNYVIYMPNCVKDTLSPVSIKLKFSQVYSETASGVLNVDGKKQAVVEVPFEKVCRLNDVCVAEIEVDFNFMTPTLLVAEENYFNVTIKLSNHGDDSYNTSLTIHYPPGLSFSRLTLIEATRPTLHRCHDLEGVLDRTVCGVNLPVYRSRSAAKFVASFYIMTDYAWNDTISINVTGNSDNTNSSSASLTKTLPVQFKVKMAITVKEISTTYLNITPDDTHPKKLLAVYKLDNPGLKAFPVNVSLFFPTKLESNFEISNYHITVRKNKTRCIDVADMNSDLCTPDMTCKVIVCERFILQKESNIEFLFSGDVTFRDLKQYAENLGFLQRYTGKGSEVTFKSFIQIDFDTQRYVLDSHKQESKDGLPLETDGKVQWKEQTPTVKWNEVRIELIVPPDQLLIILTGVGLGLLLLLVITVVMWKLGCFKRKTLASYQEQEDEVGSDQNQPVEEKTLLETTEDRNSLADAKTEPDSF